MRGSGMLSGESYWHGESCCQSGENLESEAWLQSLGSEVLHASGTLAHVGLPSEIQHSLDPVETHSGAQSSVLTLKVVLLYLLGRGGLEGRPWQGRRKKYMRVCPLGMVQEALIMGARAITFPLLLLLAHFWGHLTA